jgi:hypothetical protein
MNITHTLPRTAACRSLPLLVAAWIAATSGFAAAAEKFVFFGEQPDGTVIYVQAEPAAVRKDGRLQGWFRTVPKAPASVADDNGVQRSYDEMLALNVAECSTKRMGAASMTYRDATGGVVANFRAAPEPIDYRPFKPGTLAENMFTWLCAPKPRSAPVPSAASQSPFR